MGGSAEEGIAIYVYKSTSSVLTLTKLRTKKESALISASLFQTRVSPCSLTASISPWPPKGWVRRCALLAHSTIK